jgi:uncharacterized protein (UPF0332 family)
MEDRHIVYATRASRRGRVVNAGLSNATRLLLRQSEKDLQFADLMLKASSTQAARFAYMAAFHAAQAALTQVHEIAPKTHRGVHSLFGKLAISHAGLGADMGSFLSRAYDFKDIADYRFEREIGTKKGVETIEGARRFVARVKTSFRPKPPDGCRRRKNACRACERGRRPARRRAYRPHPSSAAHRSRRNPYRSRRTDPRTR